MLSALGRHINWKFIEVVQVVSVGITVLKFLVLLQRLWYRDISYYHGITSARVTSELNKTFYLGNGGCGSASLLGQPASKA